MITINFLINMTTKRIFIEIFNLKKNYIGGGGGTPSLPS